MTIMNSKFISLIDGLKFLTPQTEFKYEFEQNLVIKNTHDEVICTINYAEGNDIYVMTLKDQIYVFTSNDINDFNNFMQDNDTINTNINKLLGLSTSFVTNIATLNSCTLSFCINQVNILIIYRYWIDEKKQLTNSKILIITETQSKGKNITNLDIAECGKYIESQIAPTFFVPSTASSKIKRVRVKGSNEYLTNQSSPRSYEFDEVRNQMEQLASSNPSPQWLSDKANAMRDFERKLNAQNFNPNVILDKCLNVNNVNTRLNYEAHENSRNVLGCASLSGTSINSDIKQNIRCLSSFDKEALVNLHSITLSELKMVYDNMFSDDLKVVLDYFDQFTDIAMDSIREILKECNI